MTPTKKLFMHAVKTTCFGLLLLFCCTALFAQVADWKDIKTPPLPAFQPKEPTRIQLPNGMVIFLQEDHELPLIDADLMIRGGSRDEPASKIGLNSIYADVWRTGGTHAKTGDELDDFLEARAAHIETDNTAESTSMSLSCLKDDFDPVFAIFVDLLRNPEFRADKIDLSQRQMKSGISRRNDNVSQIAAREAARLAYGKDNPYARIPEYATIDAIQRDDLLRWHSQWVHPNNMILGITGDFDSKVMEQKLRAAFASWPKGPVAPAFQTTFTSAKPGIYFINKDDVNQSEIRMVALGIRRDNPDFFAVEVLNEVFGGGFAARLFSRIRTAQGLAYSVYGSVGASYDHQGMFRIGMGTKSVSTVEAIRSLDEQIDDIVKSPPTAAELQRAKDGILNSFIFRFDSPRKVLMEKMTYEFFHYPLDFLERYRAAIDKVTADDVLRVARKYIHKDQLDVLVVGNQADMGNSKLSSLGSVTPIDIAIPMPGESAAGGQAAKPAANPEGKALVAKFVKAMGGAGALANVKALEQKSTGLRKTPQGDMNLEIDNITVFPDRLLSQVNTPMGLMKMVYAPGGSFMSMGPESGDLPGAMKQDIVNGLKRDFITVAQHAGDPKYIFSGGGTEKIGEINADVLKINADGAECTWYLGPDGLPVRTKAMATSRSGPVQRVVDYSGWKPVNGIFLWTNRSVTENGEPTIQERVKEWVVNPNVDPKLFEKPAAPQNASGAGEQGNQN